MAPRGTGSQHPENPVQHTPVINAGHAARLLGHDRLYRSPFKIGKARSAHASLNHPTGATQSADFMIWNVIDYRTRPYRWKRVNAIIEATEHDNSCIDADQAEEISPLAVIDHDRRDNVSVQEAIHWANEAQCPVTLYIYDVTDGTTAQHFDSTGKRLLETDSKAGE